MYVCTYVYWYMHYYDQVAAVICIVEVEQKPAQRIVRRQTDCPHLNTQNKETIEVIETEHRGKTDAQAGRRREAVNVAGRQAEAGP